MLFSVQFSSVQFRWKFSCAKLRGIFVNIVDACLPQNKRPLNEWMNVCVCISMRRLLLSVFPLICNVTPLNDGEMWNGNEITHAFRQEEIFRSKCSWMCQCLLLLHFTVLTSKPGANRSCLPSLFVVAVVVSASAFFSNSICRFDSIHTIAAHFIRYTIDINWFINSYSYFHYWYLLALIRQDIAWQMVFDGVLICYFAIESMLYYLACTHNCYSLCTFLGCLFHKYHADLVFFSLVFYYYVKNLSFLIDFVFIIQVF